MGGTQEPKCLTARDMLVGEGSRSPILYLEDEKEIITRLATEYLFSQDKDNSPPLYLSTYSGTTETNKVEHSEGRLPHFMSLRELSLRVKGPQNMSLKVTSSQEMSPMHSPNASLSRMRPLNTSPREMPFPRMPSLNENLPSTSTPCI